MATEGFGDLLSRALPLCSEDLPPFAAMSEPLRDTDPSYDPIAAARSYAALAAVLAGFTLTAVLLVVQRLVPTAAAPDPSPLAFA